VKYWSCIWGSNRVKEPLHFSLAECNSHSETHTSHSRFQSSYRVKSSSSYFRIMLNISESTAALTQLLYHWHYDHSSHNFHFMWMHLSALANNHTSFFFYFPLDPLCCCKQHEDLFTLTSQF
jgi:hypothetical protein